MIRPTQRALEILQLIITFHGEHGRVPTVGEMQTWLGYAGPRGLSRQLHRLAAGGYLELSPGRLSWYTVTRDTTGAKCRAELRLLNGDLPGGNIRP